MTPLRLLAAGLLAGALALGAAFARPAFAGTAETQLHLADLVSGPLKEAGCTLCHVSPDGGAPWNPFGLAVGRQRAKKLPVDRALYEALRLGADVDGDDYADALEVFAGTLPGDKASRPEEAAPALAVRFEAAGGLERYAPKR